MNELGRQREQGEIALALAFSAMAGAGAWLHAPLLALFGVLGALSSSILYLWQRCCLMRLDCQRTVSAERVEFGETITVEITMTNDKILPLPWVRVVDQFPSDLLPLDHPSRAKALPLESDEPLASHLVRSIHSFALLPFSKLTRSLELTCERRGRHHFGTTQITSGDPLGIRPRTMKIDQPHELLVYPKIMRFSLPALFSRTPLGDDRARRLLLGDPTRVAGMRPYRAGDPLRHIDWRATARRNDLLVRDFEPTTTLALEILIDCQIPNTGGTRSAATPSEFAISIGASIAAWSTGLSIPTGVAMPGRADQVPIDTQLFVGPNATTLVLGTLAICVPDDSSTFEQSIEQASPRLGRGTSAVIISHHFSSQVLGAMVACRRRAPIIAIYISGLGGDPPPRRLVDESYVASYSPDWLDQDHVVFA